MNNEIKVLSLKTKVSFGENKEYKGEITAITVRSHIVVYEISYWKGEEFKTIWLSEEYFKVSNKERKENVLGFFINEKTS
jgi:hypothetical protein